MLKIVYFDLDGVLFDFLKSACKVHNRDYAPETITHFDIAEIWDISKNQFWKPIDKAGKHFWADLDVYPWSYDLVDTARDLGFQVEFLTSPSFSGDCISGKIEAVGDHFGASIKEIHFTHQKHRFLSPDSILIDDRVETWKSCIGKNCLLFKQPWSNIPQALDSEQIMKILHKIRGNFE